MYENTDPGTIKDKVDDFYKRDGSDGSLEDRQEVSGRVYSVKNLIEGTENEGGTGVHVTQ